MSEATLLRIQLIVQDVLDEDNIKLTESTMATDVPGWDSLAHVRIMVAVEKTFNIRFDTDELSSFSDVGSLVKGVEEKLS